MKFVRIYIVVVSILWIDREKTIKLPSLCMIEHQSCSCTIFCIGIYRRV